MTDQPIHSKPSEALTDFPDISLLQDITVLMRPVVRWAVVHGVGHAVLSRWMKLLFLQEAQASLLGRGGAVSDSALALAAGLHRADIHQLQDQVDGVLTYENAIPITQQVMALWFLEGLPDTIPFKSDALRKAPDGSTSFTDLVSCIRKAASQNFSASLILQDMQRQGLLKAAAGHVTQTRFSANNTEGRSQAIAHLSRAGHDLLSAGLHNLQAPESAQFLEQSLEVDGLFPGSADELHKQATQLWAQTLQTLLPQAKAFSEHDEPLGGQQRMRLGIYFFAEHSLSSSHSSSPPSGPS